jgi:Carboxypeptidase regulatory-like domain
MRQAKYRFFLLPLFLVLACVGLYAQANSELTGIVTDQSGAVVAGAKVMLTNPATGDTRTTESGPTGLYDVSGLNPANYDLKVTAKGFQSFVQTGIVVNVSATTRVDVKLSVGAESQTVTVEADALQVQTDSNVVSTLISSEQISEIATQNRNFAALAALGLGVSSALPDNNTPTSVASNFTISVNGLRQSHNIWLIDGGEADDRGGAGGMDIMPSQDAIAEFNVMSSNYPPDYGISSGATISLSLKSGTQKFHGTAYEFNRNTAFDATNPISQSNTHVRYNIFGGNLGGPVFIPHVYNTDKQKTFFFVNEEWRRLIQGAGTTNSPTLDPADHPTAGQDLTYKAPGFSSSNTLTVPSVGDPAFNNMLAALNLTPGDPMPVIPHQLFDPNAVIYLNSGVIPKPTTSDDHVVANISNPIYVRDDIYRGDHKFNDKWAILGHYMHDSVNQGYALPELGWLWASFNTITSNLSNPSSSAAIKLTGQINPNLVLETSINYDGNVIDITNSSNSLLTSSAFSGWSVQPFFPLSGVQQGKSKGQMSIPGVGGGWGGPYYVAEDTGSAPWHNAARDYEPKVDVSYMMGKHQMKFGFSYNRYTKNQQLFGDTQGNFGFGNRSGDSFMDMLMGITSSYSQFQNAPVRHYVNQTPSVYAMDNWHVTPRLSLQLGLRYDALPHAWERGNYVSNFDPSLYIPGLLPRWNSDGSMDPTSPGFQIYNGTPFYLNGVGLAGQNGFPRGLVKNDYGTLQPRVGFSEDLFGNGKTVIRGGFGTFFERMQGNDIYNAATTPPFAFNPSASSVYFSTPTKSWVTGAAAATPTFASGITNLSHTYKAPAVAQFSLGVQREISPSVIWVVQYVGNLAWHQNVERHINTYPLSFINTTSTVTDPNGTQYTVQNTARAGDNTCAFDGNVTIPDPKNPGKTTTFCTHQSLVAPDQYRTWQGWGDITQQENTTNGNYNGFQTGVRVQNRWGLSGEIDYTWSHEIDLTTYDLNLISNPWNMKYDKGSGALDRRNMLNANYVYKLPFFNRSSSGLEKSLLGGWELAGTVISQSGSLSETSSNQGPSLSITGDPIGLDCGGGCANRPNVSGKVHYTKTYKPWNGQNQWFDTSIFSKPVPVWDGGPNMGFGNARKDAIVGPGRTNFTTSIYKNFAISERMHVEFRAESYNTFNHFQPKGLGVAYGSSQFGQITSSWDPRSLQLGGKFIF